MFCLLLELQFEMSDLRYLLTFLYPIHLLCTDGGFVLKGRALIPEVIVDQGGESSAGQERATTRGPSPDPRNLTESTILWRIKKKDRFLFLKSYFTFHASHDDRLLAGEKKLPFCLLYWLKPKTSAYFGGDLNHKTSVQLSLSILDFMLNSFCSEYCSIFRYWTAEPCQSFVMKQNRVMWCFSIIITHFSIILYKDQRAFIMVNKDQMFWKECNIKFHRLTVVSSLQHIHSSLFSFLLYI